MAPELRFVNVDAHLRVTVDPAAADVFKAVGPGARLTFSVSDFAVVADKSARLSYDVGATLLEVIEP